MKNRAILQSIRKWSYDHFPAKCYNVICVNKLGQLPALWTLS